MSDVMGKAAEAVAGEAGKGVAQLMGSAYRFLSGRAARESVDSGAGFVTYLERATSILSKTKTILYSQPQEFYSFFEPTDLLVGDARPRRAGNATPAGEGAARVSTARLEDVLAQGSRLVITGSGGIGKSMLMQHLFLSAAAQGELVPVLVELRRANATPTTSAAGLADIIYQTLCEYGCAFDRPTFDYSLDAVDYLLLLDGYDELSAERAPVLANELETLCHRHPHCQVVITSRPLDDFGSWRDFAVLQACPLTKRQALTLVEKLRYDDEVKHQFVDRLDKELFERHQSFATNPLLLTMMLMVFSERADIPEGLCDFYDQTFSTLLFRHDATKRGMFRRQLRSGLGDEDFRRVFERLCFTTFLKGQFDFSRDELCERIDAAAARSVAGRSVTADDYLYDLQVGVCLMARDGLRYRFVHRSFQEYFAARHTAQLGDEQQGKVVRAWMHENVRALANASSVYLDALFDLQPDRYVRNVLYAPLLELRDRCRASDEPDWCYLEAVSGPVLAAYPLGHRDGPWATRDLRVLQGWGEQRGVVCELLRRYGRPVHRGIRRLSRDDPQVGRLADYLARDFASSKKGLSGLQIMDWTFSELRAAGLGPELLYALDGDLQNRDELFALVGELERAYAEREHGEASILDNLDEL